MVALLPTRVVIHDLYPSKEALDEAIAGRVAPRASRGLVMGSLKSSTPDLS